MSKPLLVIPSYISQPKHIEVLNKCVYSLRQSTDEDLLIIDDGSPISQSDKDAVYNQISSHSVSGANLRIVYQEENGGFSKTVNVGLRRALEDKRDVCLINSDIEFVEFGWLKAMQATDAGIIGALLFYPNMLIQHAGIYFSILTRAFQHRFACCPPNLPAALEEEECQVTAALQYIRYEVLEDIGIYDEDFRLGMEDVDFTMRAVKAGHRSLYNPKVKAVHHESLVRKDKTDKIKEWEILSYKHLLKKYKGVYFDEVPTMMEKKHAVSK